MKLSQNLNLSAIGLALACVACSSSALTLGRASGAAILGRPLEVTVAVQLAADEESGGICFEADVFYGDSRQDSSRVVVSSDSPPPGTPLKVRVSSSAPVDEPIVTVYLRAACAKQATRRYVLLADLVSDLAPPVVAFPAARLAANVPLLQLPPPQSPAVNVMPPVVSSAPATAPKKPSRAARTQPNADQAVRRPVADVATATLSASNSPVVGSASVVNRRARLKLAPIDFTLDLDPALKISTELPFLPLENLQKRSEAIALWQSLNASPEDILRDGARMQSMEQDLKTLQDVALNNRQLMQGLTERLDRAESQRYANPLIYGLVALLMACGAGLAYLFFRLRAASFGPSPWWHGPHEEESPKDVDIKGTASDVPKPSNSRPVAQPGDSAAVAVAGLSAVDIDLQAAKSPFNGLGNSAAAVPVIAPKPSVPVRADDAPGRAKFSQSMFGVSREISTEEMLDVRQQADFFMTLGQYDEAIEVLEERIQAGGELNPLIYLDLLKVLHTLSKKAEYDSYRGQFNEFFSGNVPAYALFSQQGRNLDAYPGVCNRIVALWPTLDAVEYLEKCLVRATAGDASSGFDLETFTDLLMLHGVARRLVSSSESGLLPFSAQRMSTNAVETPMNVALSLAPLTPNAVLPDSGALDIPLDFDLSEPASNLIEFDGLSFSVSPDLK